MWRKLALTLTSMLFLFTVAQIATASPIPENKNDGALGHEKLLFNSKLLY